MRATGEVPRRIRRKALATAEGVAKSWLVSRVVIAAQAGDEGKLFGSIGTVMSWRVSRSSRVWNSIRKTVKLDAPIKSIGLHEVTVVLHPRCSSR